MFVEESDVVWVLARARCTILTNTMCIPAVSSVAIGTIPTPDWVFVFTTYCVTRNPILALHHQHFLLSDRGAEILVYNPVQDIRE